MSALTTWLTAIADAIRGKDGTALPIDHADFPAKITAIPQLDTSDADAVANDLLYGKTAYVNGVKLTGEGAYWQEMTTISNAACHIFNSNIALTGAINFRIPKAASIGSMFYGCSNITSLILTVSTALIYAPAFARNCSGLITVTLSGSMQNVTHITNAFSGCTDLVTIDGDPFNFTSVSNTSNFVAICSSLENIAFVASTIKVNISFSHSPLLTTTSLLSIANGLDAASPATLSMHGNAKTNMLALMVNDVAGVAVAGTTMTLTAFIQNTKGWTVA